MRVVHQLISILFHPILLPIAGTFYYFYLNNESILDRTPLRILALIGIGTYIIPIILLIILKAFKRIKSYEVSTIKERKTPLIFMIGMFFILGNSLLKVDSVFLLATLFISNAVSLSLTYILFVTDTKTSIHMIGMASFTAFLIIFSFITEVNLLFEIGISIVLSGLVALSRLELKSHTMSEILIGYTIGFLSVVTVTFIYSLS